MENTIRPLEYSKGDLNPHNRNGQGILSPSCLPIPPFEHPVKEERKTRLELATLTLARLCSTNWAISAFLTGAKIESFIVSAKYSEEIYSIIFI